MRIIKMGNLTTNINTCPHCNCEYEYNEADIYTGYELTMQYAYVICPCCGQINRINTLPPNKWYPPLNPTIFGYTYCDASNHIPIIDSLHDQCDCLHEPWNPDLKEEDKNGDV